MKTWVGTAWLPDVIDRCRATGANNDPKRRYFATPFSGGVWGGYMFYINKQEAKVRFHGRRDGDVGYWENVLPGASISTWGNEDTQQGIAIPLSTADALDRFIAGLATSPPSADAGRDGTQDDVSTV